MMRSFWIAPAAAFAAVLMFSSPAKADRWGFSVRVGSGGYSSRDCAPRYSDRKTYRRSTYDRGDRHYTRSRDHYPRDGYEVRRSGHGRSAYRGESRRSYSRSYSRSGHYRSPRYSRGSRNYRCR
jgi:hypothetical protein